MKKTYIIAEAGVNHNGDVSLAKELIAAAAEAKADAVKFQTFTTEEEISKIAPQAEYQKKNTGVSQSQFEMVKALELSQDEFLELYNYSKKHDITFLSTGFDHLNMTFLVDKCKIPYIKIPSGEITSAPYLYKVAQHRLPLIVSTGMATIPEIEQTLAVLSYGWSRQATPSSLQECLDFYDTAEGRNILKGQVTLLHCITEYPAPYKDANLRAMQTIAEHFDMPVGLSDHTLGIHIPIAAVAMGASVIEKHFTLDKTLAGPDHKASLEPDELKNMVTCIRDIEKAMGNGEKVPQKSEIKNIAIARRSLVAAQPIEKGDTYKETNITCKRPGNGISSMQYWDYLNKECPENIKEDELVK